MVVYIATSAPKFWTGYLGVPFCKSQPNSTFNSMGTSKYNDLNGSGTCGLPYHLDSILTSPLCLLVITGYAMLFISPLTRVLARDFLNLLSYLATSLVELAWRSRGTSPAEVRNLRSSLIKTEDALRSMEERELKRFQEYTEVQQALVDDNSKVQANVDKASRDNKELQLALINTRKQLKYFQEKGPNASVHQEKTDLEAEVENLRGRLADRTLETDRCTLKIQNLEQVVSDRDTAIEKLEQAAEKAETCEKELHQENFKLQDDIADLQREISTKNQHTTLLNRIAHILHTLASTNDPDTLPVAVLFAKALYVDGINLVDLDIDQRRLDILAEYVQAGMSKDHPIQPQNSEPGFRLKSKPGIVSGIRANGAAKIEYGYDTPLLAERRSVAGGGSFLSSFLGGKGN